jgi:integrase
MTAPQRRSRRANGDGTITRRANGLWQGAAYVTTTRGIRRREYVYGRDRDEVRAKLNQLLSAEQARIPVSHERWTVEAYLSYWLEHVVRPSRAPKTHQGYELAVRLHIVPVIGKKRLPRLATQDVRAVLARVQEGGGSPRTVQFVHAVLRAALETAFREEIVSRNVAKLVRAPAPRSRISRGVSADDARKILQAAARDRLSALYVLALYLGLRRGELLGLRWADVDLEVGRLEVVQTLQRVEGRLQFVRPKTRRSERTIPLPDVVVAALREHRARQAKERLAAGSSWTDSGLVFTSRVGTPVEPDNLRRSWYEVRTVLDAPLRLHDLRHTCVTLLLEAGVAPHIVQQIAGHSALDVTMNIYAHASLEEKRAALRLLSDRLA